MNTRKGSGTATLERPTVAAPGSRADAYQQVTDQVIAMLEAGTAPWHQPWNTETGLPRSRVLFTTPDQHRAEVITGLLGDDDDMISAVTHERAAQFMITELTTT